jgi:hypothetical protein
MASRYWHVVTFALGTLAGVTSTALVLSREKPPTPASAPAACPEDDDDAMAANASLASSLQECNRQLARLGQKNVDTSAVAAPADSSRSARDRRSAVRPPPSAEDWTRYAEAEVVPYRIPCLRSTPFSPSTQQLDRLGLAPQDGDAVKEAYAKSNERMAAQIRPLCASVVGGTEAADRIGSSACMTAITDAARRESPDKMKEALVRVGEVNAGKRAAPAQGEPVSALEAMLVSLTTEARTFESDLASRIGPDDARIVAGSRSMCSESATVSAVERGPGQAGGGAGRAGGASGQTGGGARR